MQTKCDSCKKSVKKVGVVWRYNRGVKFSEYLCKQCRKEKGYTYEKQDKNG